MSFVHLHVHSEYSLLDGFSNIKKLVKRAKEMEMPALALTDHGTMFGVIDFYNTAVKAGIKPIIGVEGYLAARGMQDRNSQLDKKSSHLLLLAENQTGYLNLLQIASAAQLEGFYYFPRIDHEFLAQHAEGLICTSGCMSAEVPRLIQAGNLEPARELLDWYYEVFGPDRFFLELQSHDIEELEHINKNLIQLGRRYDARFVATNDVHYVDRGDARYQDILLAIQTGCVLSDPNRMRMSDESYYLRSPQEMAAIFQEVPEAITNTMLIADQCQVDLDFKGYRLPHFEVPDEFTPETYLKELCALGLRRRYGSRADDPEVLKRLDYELGIIHKMGFNPYFLIVWDLCRYAREQEIWYNARGSAAGSIVAYALDITLVDPIEHGLIFERFLNPGRVSMPDIDLDFRDDRRADMMEYTAHKYGDDKVAQIITFGTLGARAAIRDVGRVMDIPLNEVDRVAKMVPNIPGKPVNIPQAIEEVAEFKQAYESTSYLRDLIDTAAMMEGVVRSAGTHAAGVIITDKPIIEYIPLHRPTGSSAEDSPVKTVTQFEMSILDSLGLLKVDFLGLATLTIMARACDLIRERHGVDLNLDNIPTDDPKTYELLGRGETAGVFQVEGSGMRRWLMQMKPKELANVIAMVALFRPGPMDFIPGYIQRMHGKEEVSYRHPALEPIFKETYGYPVYQEQLMFAVMDLAGYTAPEADDLRKAVAKKIASKLEKHSEKFVKGAVKNGIPQETAEAIFADWEEFARYGFNKAHAADYGTIAVQTGYLKSHYPVEYMTALLSVTQNDTDKVALYVADCRRMSIPVAPPDVGASGWDFTIEDNANGEATIRFGLGAVKNVGQGPVAAILEGRGDEPFTDLNDFTHRVDLRHVGRRALECLIRVGSLDSFGPRVSLLEGIERILSVSTSHFRAVEMGQMSLFGAQTGIAEEIVLPATYTQVSQREILNWERELIGLYVSDHPLNPVIKELNQAVTHFSGQLAEAGPNEKVRVAGLVVNIRHHQTKNGQPMAFVTIEDLQGSIELVIFPRTWKNVSKLIEYDKVILVDGRPDTEASEPKVLVDRITTDFTMVVSKDQDDDGMIDNASVLSSRQNTENPLPLETSQSDIPTKTALFQGQDSRENVNEVIEISHETQDQDNPPPPDAFPPGWEYLDTEYASLGEVAAQIFETGLPEAEQVGETDSDSIEMAEQVDQPTKIRETEIPVSREPEPAIQLQSEDATPQVDTTINPDTENETEHIIHTIPDTYEKQGQYPQVETQEVGKEDLTPAVLNYKDLKEQSTGATKLTSYLISPVRTPETGTEQIQMVTVVLRTTGDKTRDVLRLRRIHGSIMSFPGNDRFAFRVFERERGYMVEFPNFSTGVCPELISKLRLLVGSKNVIVEPITFQ